MTSCKHQPGSCQSSVFVAGLSLGLCLVVGCGGGDDGPPRFRATGVVKCDGTPVASGRITFAPDNAQGNKGPAGWAMIQAGAYDTAGPGGKSPVSGPMTVIITGYGEPPAKKVETQEPLFQDYKTTANIDPAEADSILDFEVPLPPKKKS